MARRYVVLFAVLMTAAPLVTAHLGEMGGSHTDHEATAEQDTAGKTTVQHPSENPTAQAWALGTAGG